ncbi:hypothetical protein KSP35_18440 [Aquihabitans sp. G128]|uniref:hypothetical protein n=1 Tax=Aquihabitans sp. G128 TaxID=2849779 RepID=UPI001C218CD4|nr:hypothetical protein [Aquihabitans sp. G128]QXC60294.1 hypothetical protein KSP35_18440 [Aquihabitans sp. G128]
MAANLEASAGLHRPSTERLRRAVGALVAVAAVLALAQAVVDVAARAAEIRAVPALVALHLDLVLIVVVAIALVLRLARRSPGPRGAGGWRLATAGAATIAIVAIRYGVSPAEPTRGVLVPLLLVPAAALLADLVRTRGDLGPQPLFRGALAWCSVAGADLLALSVGAGRVERLDVGPTLVRPAGISVVVVAGVAAVAASRSRSFFDAAAMALAAAAGAGLVAVGSPADRTVPAGTPLLAAGVLAAALVAWEPARRRAGALGRRVATLAARPLGPVRRRASAARARAATPTPVRVEPRPRLDRRSRLVAGAMAMGSAAFVGSGAWWAHRVGWQPTGHSATVMARSYDVGTADHPLVGMITSLGNRGFASHPGPLLFDLLAPLVRAFGIQGGALVGGVVAAVTCWWVATWAAWRAGGAIAAVVAWVTSALVLQIAALGMVADANNVSLTVPAMFTAVVAAWAACTGTWRAWWWALVLGSLAAQAYLPHGLIVLGPVLWSGWVVARARKAQDDPASARRARSAWRVGWVIGVLVWLQPVIEAITSQGGNVRTLAGEVANPEPSVGLGGIPRFAAWLVAVPPRWNEVTRSFALPGAASDYVGGSVLAGLLVLALLCGAWYRTRRAAPPRERQLRILVALVVVGAMVDATQLPSDLLHSFQLLWLVVASLTVWFAVATSLCFAAERRLAASAGAPRRRRVAVRVGGAFAAAVFLVAAVSGPNTIGDVKGSDYTIDAMVGPLTDQTLDALPDRTPVLVLGLDTRFNVAAFDTVTSHLIVGGIPVRVEPAIVHYGARRQVHGSWDGPMLWVTSGVPPVKPAGTRLAAASVPGWSKARFDRLAEEVGRQARSGPSLRIEPWALDALPRYVGAWISDRPCQVVADIRSGRRSVASLPAGLLLVLYADAAIASPALPAGMLDRATAIVGQGPIEVWRVERDEPGPISSDLLLRDGTSCPTAPGAGR